MPGPNLRALVRVGMLRGVIRGSRLWLYVGLGAWVLAVVQRMATRKPVVVMDKLRPGERILVTHFKRNQA